MTTTRKITISTVVIAILAFPLTRVIWPDAPDAVGPPSSLLPWFIVLGAIEAVSFGLGVSMLVFCWKEGQRHLWPFLAVVWLLMSWWPHDNLHRVAHENNFLNLLIIEYVFHVTLMIAGFILARFLVKNVLSERTARNSEQV
ncbi:MAG: hypothetical protein WD200_02275 [Candidatus Andersenbacteria bacterium]